MLLLRGFYFGQVFNKSHTGHRSALWSDKSKGVYGTAEINWNDSFCLRIGQRHDVQCGQVVSSSGQIFPWKNKIRYLGIYITRSREFKWSLDIAKQSFYRAANAIFRKVGRHVSEEVILQLVSSKCVPVLLYGLEACPLNKTSVNSLDFVIDRFFYETV